MMRNLQGYSQKAFTLIEILLVVIIIGALSSMVLPRLIGRSDQAKKTAAKVDIDTNIATALKLYELDNGNFPDTEQWPAALLTKPASGTVPEHWNGPYLERGPIDPWGRAYIYKSPGSHRPDYDLFSLGKDGKESEDDIRNWE
jgi:general secretion pathway protein G